VQPDDLYGLPLDRFVAERGALAKDLRAEGRRDDAARVAKLRKPSTAAWAVNQLVRTQGPAVSELFDAADALRDAQAELLAGRGDARRLREAGARERAAIDGLVATARGLLTADGHELGETTLERVGETLRAAARDDAAREEVRGGCLQRELRHVGLGLGEAAAALAPASAPAKRGRAAADEDAERRAKEAARTAAAAAERKAARNRAKAAVAKAVKREERAGQALRAAQRRRDRAAHALEEAEAALDEARGAAEQAAEERRRARAALDED
jgi:hypothetical protein